MARPVGITKNRTEEGTPMGPTPLKRKNGPGLEAHALLGMEKKFPLGFFLRKNVEVGAGEMAQELRALAPLSEDPL